VDFLEARGWRLEARGADFSKMRGQFSDHDGVRSIIVVELTDISDSCGYGVPLFRYEGQREQHGAWARKLGPDGIRTYQQKSNRRSLDGLSGISSRD